MWTQLPNGRFQRSDTVRVLKDPGLVKRPYVVEGPQGTLMKGMRGGTKCPRHFATQESAMRAADQAWPLTAKT